jgi:hypothetical protein
VAYRDPHTKIDSVSGSPKQDAGAASTWLRLIILLKDYAPALTVLAAVEYALLRVAYFLFYLALRTTPEEVGYGYARILSESVVGAFELVLLVFCPLFVAAALLHGASKIWSRRRWPRRTRSRKERKISTVSLRQIARHIFVVSIVVITVTLPLLGLLEGKVASSGRTVRNVHFLLIPRLPVLSVQAAVARVDWVNPASDEHTNLSNQRCLLYLGEADGIDVFYDVRLQQSLRVPAASVFLSLLSATRVPENCKIGSALRPRS